MLTDIEKSIIIFAAEQKEPFAADSFVQINSSYKIEAAYAALKRLDNAGILSSVKQRRETGEFFPLIRLYKTSKAGRHIAKGLLLLLDQNNTNK